MIGQAGVGPDDWRLLAVAVGLLLFATTGVVLQSRSEWKLLRHHLFKKPPGLAELDRPGTVAGHLAADRWASGFGEALGRARRDLEGGGPGARATVGALGAAEGEVARLAREVALRAMKDGEPRSILIRLDGALAYAMAMPGRPDDRRALRRQESLAEGWPSHAAAVRRAAADGEGVAPPMVALLTFLGLDARDGTLLVAYEGDEGRLLPAALAEAPVAPAPPSIGPAWTYEFALA